MRLVLALEVLLVSLVSHAFAVVVHIPATTPCPSYAITRLRARRESSTFDETSARSVLSTALKPETSVSSLDDYYEHNLSLDTLIEERSSAAWFTNLPYDVRTWADDFYRNDYVTGPGTTVPYDDESSAPVYGGGSSRTTATRTVTAEESSTSNTPSTSSTSITNQFDVLPTQSPSPSRPSLAASTSAPEESPSQSKSESPSKIIGIAVGVAFSCLFIALLLFLIIRRRRRRLRQDAAVPPPHDHSYEKDGGDAQLAPLTLPPPAEVHGEIYELPAADKGPEMSGSTGYHSPERPRQVYEAMAVEARGGGNGGEARGGKVVEHGEAGKWKGS